MTFFGKTFIKYSILGTMGATIVDQQVNADSQYDQSGPLVFSLVTKLQDIIYHITIIW